MASHEVRSGYEYNEELGVYDRVSEQVVSSNESESVLITRNERLKKIGVRALKFATVGATALAVGYSGAHMAGNFAGTKLDDVQHLRLWKAATEMDIPAMWDDLLQDGSSRMRGEK